MNKKAPQLLSTSSRNTWTSGTSEVLRSYCMLVPHQHDISACFLMKSSRHPRSFSPWKSQTGISPQLIKRFAADQQLENLTTTFRQESFTNLSTPLKIDIPLTSNYDHYCSFCYASVRREPRKEAYSKAHTTKGWKAMQNGGDLEHVIICSASQLVQVFAFGFDFRELQHGAETCLSPGAGWHWGLYTALYSYESSEAAVILHCYMMALDV